MKSKKLRTAMVYDFDGTLAPGNMQEHSFINRMGTTKEAFWQRVKTDARKHNADEILIYMRLMLELAAKNGIPITKKSLRQHGKGIPLYRGLENGEWFDRINAFAASQGLALEHYILSSGNQEIVAGCPIYDRFRHVFASQFL